MTRSSLGVLTALLLLLAVASPAQAEVKASASGAWSDPGTWGGRAPGPQDAVTIAGGRTVTVDGDARAASVHVADGGTLAFAQDRSATLEVGGNLGPAKATTTTAHRHDVPAAVTAHLETEAHHHGEGLFGLTIPLLDEPLDAKHAIGFGVLAVLIPLLCYASVRIDRRYQRRMQQLRAARAQRPGPPPPPPYTYGDGSGGEDDWWSQSASRWRSDTPSWP